MYTITFRFEQEALKPVTLNHVAPGQSLLEVALKHEIGLKQNCGGVCACSTCHVYIEQGAVHLKGTTDQEEAFIDRAINPRLNSRLGCQCVLHPGGGDVTVTVPDQGVNGETREW